MAPSPPVSAVSRRFKSLPTPYKYSAETQPNRASYDSAPRYIAAAPAKVRGYSAAPAPPPASASIPPHPNPAAVSEREPAKHTQRTAPESPKLEPFASVSAIDSDT